MRSDKEIEAAAAAAAEKANGGKFSDPLFYKLEHQEFWREVIRTALEAANAASSSKGEAPPKISPKEVEEFSSYCVYIRSVYTLAMRIWRDSDDRERETMNAVAAIFFEDIGMVLSEFLVIAACRVTDPANAGRGRENFTAELFTKSFSSDPETFKKLNDLLQRMLTFRAKILPARNKVGAHADRAVILKGEPLATATWKEWDEFWTVLADFVRTLNEKTTGEPFEINAAGVFGDAESLLKALRQSQHFETLLKGMMRL
jgi:hypothetical protein